MTDSRSRAAAAHDWLTGQGPAVAERLRRWCRQNSGSYHLAGLRQMAELLVSDMSDLGVVPERVALPEWREIDDAGDELNFETAPALLWHCRPQALHRVLLLIHYDTVYPASAAVEIRTEGSRLVAPGAADAKGGIAVLHLALAAIERFQLAPSVGWSILLNPDEEIGSPASRGLMQAIAQDFDFGLVFEPALPDGAWVADRKGSGNWIIVVRGLAAHAGRNPQQGRNAIVRAAALVQALDSLNDPVGGRTVNVGRIRGGGPLNRVPDLAILRTNVRIADPADEVFVAEQFRHLVERCTGDGFVCSLHGGWHAPVKRADAAARHLRARMEEAAHSVSPHAVVQWRDTGGACDGSKLAAYGLPNIDTLGPRGDHLHSPAEYCDLDSLVPAARTIMQAIHDFAAAPEKWPTRRRNPEPTAP